MIRGRTGVVAVCLCLLVVAVSCGDDSESQDDVATTPDSEDTSGADDLVEMPEVAGSLDTAGLGDPYHGPLMLDLPTDCVVPVAETAEKRGQTAELTYEWTLDAEGDNTVMGWNDMRVIEVEGRAVPAAQQEVISTSFMLPSMVINPAGAVVEVRGIPEMIEAVVESQPALAEVAYSPGFADVLEETVTSKYWTAWVGFWALWGSIDETVEEGFVGDGGEQTPFVITSLGTTIEGMAALRYERSVTGDQATQSIDALASSIAPDASQADADGATEPVDVSIDDLIEVVTDPATLLPRSVLYERTVTMTTDGQTQSQVERRVSRLDWEAADCAV